ncbi:Ig-like domain-containing protein [Luteolibacter marinus]|uniref:Ig-like domain-containing protein n=1 Tax=Luteolibacter marinus TaxID=2776705 RepID=UPI001865A4ED|nr:Ig-like domain-containing protein [Luteolibacter marinus]
MEFPSRFLPLLSGLVFAGAISTVSAAAPTLTNISDLPGVEDTVVQITYADLLAASNANDSDGDTIEFRFKSGISGTLRNGTEVVLADAVLGVGVTWNWTPPADSNGVINGFNVRAYANGEESTSDRVVQFDLDAVNDKPSFTKGANQTFNEDSGSHSISNWATAISTGPANESSQNVSFVVTANDRADLFSAGPSVSSSGTLSFTFAANKNGTATISLKVTDNGGTANGGVDESATQTFTITANAVNDAPSFTKGATVTVDEDTGVVTRTNWATAISAGPSDESGQTLTFEITSNTNPGIFQVAPSLASNGTLSFTTKADENGTATIGVRLKDNGGVANGGSDQSAIQTFNIVVTAVPDPPVLGGAFKGTEVAPLSDEPVGDTGIAVPADIFGLLAISDVDQGRPGNDAQTITVTVSNDAATYGTFSFPGSSVSNGATEKTYTLTAATPSAAQTALRAARFTPFANALPVGIYHFGIKVEVKDSTTPTALQATPIVGDIYVESVNNSPEVTATLFPSSISDSAEAQPFRLSVSDPDPGDTYSVTITETSATTRGNLVFLTNPITGSAAEVATGVQAVRYQPFQQADDVTATFDVAVTDIHPTGGMGEAVTEELSLEIAFVNNPPEIAGITTELLRTTNDPAALELSPVYPFATIMITDGDPGQTLTVTLSLDDPAKGGFSSEHINEFGQIVGTAQEVTEYLREVIFVPASNRPSETVTITISVSDDTATRTNSLTQIEVTAVNGAPRVSWDLTAENPAGIFPSFSNPALIDPSPSAKPFAKVTIEDEGEIVVTVSLDEAAKGELTDLGSFEETPAGSRIYQYTGDSTTAETSIQGMTFVPDPGYLFPPDQPGRTDFTIQASDSLLNVTTRVLPIILESDARNFLVTSLLDDELTPGTLRHAVSVAKSNDIITFALPTYPAVIRMSTAKGPLVIDKHLSFMGPGADKLTISGDSNANGSTDSGDVQLFQIYAGVHIKGLRLARGFAATGGAISVARLQPDLDAGSLVIEDCILSNCLATQWGGAIDVAEGSLTVARCLFEGNRLNASSGLGGGAVSLYTNASCSFLNTTFSGNQQAAPTGFGGGALYVENDTPNRFFQTTVTHCTFTGNIDASNLGSSIHSNVSNTRVLLTNSLFGDFSARNLQVAGGGEIVSNGGNLSNDNTTTTLIQGGVPQQAVLLSKVSDKRNTDPKLAPISTLEGHTRGHRLLPDSPAVGAGLAGNAVVDQRGVLRNGTTDIGAIDANSLGKLIIHEIYASQDPAESDFIEFFNPRDQVAVDLSGYEIWINGLKRHVFSGSQVVKPGFGIILADTMITPASASTPVVLPSISLPAPIGTNLDLQLRGRIELRAPTSDGAKVVESVAYNAIFANSTVPTASLDTAMDSITLAPQFQGAAFVPHGMVQAPPNGGVLLNATGDHSSPGADAGGTPFGVENAYPIVVNDSFEITEDELVQLNVLANDLDADGSDELFVVDLNPSVSAVPPASNKSTIQTSSGATVTVNPATAPLRGVVVDFDPRTAFNSLPEGARVTDSFAYSIIDVGGGAIGGYADGGPGVMLVTAPSHRLASGEVVTIRDAGPAVYNGSHTITVVDSNTFSIPVAFTSNPAPLSRGRWQAVEIRDPSARDEALVQVSVLGRNDAPTPADDLVSTNEDTVLRIFADPDLATTGMALNTDGLYSTPILYAGTGLLANDTDPDTNDNPFTELHVIGVCQANPITGYSGTPGASPVTVTAAGHGLATGDVILISGYGGHPSYNGYQEITVVDGDSFTIPVGFVDDAPAKGLWTMLDDSNRLATTSALGAQVNLEIRANRIQTNVVYDPRVSEYLNGLRQVDSATDSFYYAVEDNDGAVSLALVSIDVAGVNDAPVPADDPDGLASLDGLLGGGLTLGELLSGSEILYLLPGSSQTGGVNVAIRPPGGGFNDVSVVAGLSQTDEDTAIDFARTDLIANDSDVDRLDELNIEIAAGQQLSREGAQVSISPDGMTLTYDPSSAPKLQALAFKERIIDTFVITITDGIAKVESLVAVLVEGRNDQPQASAVALTTPEKSLLEVGPPGLLDSGLEIDVNTHLPDNRKSLLPVADVATTVFGAKVNVVRDLRDGTIDGFAQISGVPAATAVNSTAHGLQSGEEVVLLGSGELTGQFVITRIDDNSFSIPVAYDAGFSSLGGGTWNVVASTFLYDPRGSVFSDSPGGPTFTLQGLAEGQTYLDTFTYTLLDGSFLFANDDIYRIAADRENIELKVLDNDTNLEGLATGRRIVEVGPPSAGGTVVLNGDQSLIYAPETGFVGDEVFVYTIEDDIGNRDSARVTARVTVDRLNGNLRANADSFSVATGQSPLLDVLANDNIIPATGDPLTLVTISSAPDQGGTAAIENGSVRYTPDPAALVFPYTETFGYTMSGGGTATATATVTVLVVDRKNTLNVRADTFSVPASSNQVVLNVLENDNILPGTGEALLIESVTAAAHGTVTILNDAALSYTPAAGFLGTDTFSYTAVDGFGGTGTALVTIQVGYLTTNSDIYSVAFDDPAETDDDGITSLDVLANDNVLQGGGGQVTLSGVTPTSVALGTMSVAPDGSVLRFDPAEGATGQQDFTYTISDATGRTANGTVTVVVIASGIRASSDYFTVQSDSEANELPVLSNDLRISDLPGQLSVAAIGTGPDAPDQGGSVDISADFKKIIYTPAPGFSGVESFTYTVTDGDSFDTARVSVRSTIGAMVAGGDSFFVFRGSSDNRLAVLSNDRVIPDAGQLLFITATGMDAGNPDNPPVRGSLSIIEDGGALLYTPSPANETFPYVETFSYEISAGGTARSEAIIRIEVLDRVGVRDLETNNDVFSVRSDSTGTLLPVLANDSVLPASAAGWDITTVTPATSNVCSPFLNGDFPDAAAFAAVLEARADPVSEFLWTRFSPASQSLLADPATSTVQLLNTLVSEFNDVVESGASIYDATRFAGVVLREQTQGLLDEGVSGEQLIVLNRLLLEDAYPAGIRQAQGGGAVQIIGNDILYAPQPGFVGTERFTYRVSDGLGGTGFGEVIVRVGDISVSDDAFTLLAGSGPMNLDVVANDGVLVTSFPATPDPAQADFTLATGRVITVDPASAGDAVAAGDVVTFTPDAGFVGRAELTYWVIDDSGCEYPGTARLDIHAPGEDRDSAVASITVTGVNDAPKILNAVQTNTLDTDPVMPFANATVVEYDDQRAQPVRMRITYPIGHGVLGGGFTEISPGVLEFYGTAAEITAALRGLVFTPIIDRITVGTTEDTLFLVSLDDGFTAEPVIVDSAVTVVTPVNDLPVITGTVAGQKLYQRSTLHPFAGVNITDIDDLTVQPQTVTVQLDNAIKGIFTNLGGFVESPAGSGSYVFHGTPAESSVALRGLVFQPTPGERVTALVPEIVGLTVSIDDGFAPPVVDTVTTVVVLHAEIDRLLPLGVAGEDVSQGGAAFGTSVAIDGNTMVVGSPARDTSLVDAGRVDVYERDAGLGAPWGQVATLIGADTIAGDRFGQAVAIDGDYMVIGAPDADVPGANNAGAAYIFHRDPVNPNAWSQVAKLVSPAPNGSGGDSFGTGVAIQGSTVLVGAPNSNRSGAPRAGRAYAFVRGAGGPTNWTLSQTLLATELRSSGLIGDGEFFGSSLALDGNTAVIGSHGANSGTNSANWNTGAAYVFTRADESSLWAEVKRLDEFGAPDTPNYYGYGFSVDVSGDRIVVGVHSPGNPSNSFKPGSARIYERNAGGTNVWGLVSRIEPYQGIPSANFGYAVSISDDLVLIGAPGPNQTSVNLRGSVEVYRRTPGVTPVWTGIDRLTASEPSAADQYGTAVAIDGFIGVAGAPTDSVNALNILNAGSARVLKFHYDLGPRLTLQVPDQVAVIDSLFNFTIDGATFDDPVSPGQLQIGVQLSNGDPLPPTGWLSFDPITGTFSGTPVSGNSASYDLVLHATNPLGSRILSNVFSISVDAGSGSVLDSAYLAWAVTQFSQAVVDNPLLEASVWGSAANPDHDANSNLLEMLFGTDPGASEPSPLVFVRISDTQVSLTFPITAEFPLGDVHVEWSTDNLVWSRDGVVLVPAEVTPGELTMTATVTLASPATKVFVRVVAGS